MLGCLVFFGCTISSLFSSAKVIGYVIRLERSRCEILGVENPNLFFVYYNEQQALREEEALIYRDAVADVKTI